VAYAPDDKDGRENTFADELIEGFVSGHKKASRPCSSNESLLSGLSPL
jgi:hypothetical protein